MSEMNLQTVNPSDSDASASLEVSSATDGGSSPLKTGTGTGGRQLMSSSRKRVIDETQLSPEEAEKLQSRRAYNRDCATRARKRTKNLVAQLQDEVKNLQADKNELRRANEEIKTKLANLEKQNQTLLFKQAMSGQNPVAPFPYGATPNSCFTNNPMSLDTAFSGILMSHQATSRSRLAFPPSV